MMTTPRPNGALPVGRLIRHAYLDTLANLPALVRIGGLWLLLAWALMLLARGGVGETDRAAPWEQRVVAVCGGLREAMLAYRDGAEVVIMEPSEA